MSTTFHLASDLSFGSLVHIDGGEMVAVVTGFQFREFGVRAMVEVSWVHNGDAKSAWIEEWRLKERGK